MTETTETSEPSTQPAAPAGGPRKYESWGIKEAAAYLRIHPDTLAYRARTGEIPGCKVGAILGVHA